MGYEAIERNPFRFNSEAERNPFRGQTCLGIERRQRIPSEIPSRGLRPGNNSHGPTRKTISHDAARSTHIYITLGTRPKEHGNTNTQWRHGPGLKYTILTNRNTDDQGGNNSPNSLQAGGHHGANLGVRDRVGWV